MATLEVTETKVEPPHRKNHDPKGNSYKIGGRQFPMDFPLLKNQDQSGSSGLDIQSVGKEATKGNSLLNVLKSRTSDGPGLFGADSQPTIVHFDRMGTDISGASYFLGQGMAPQGGQQLSDLASLASLLKPKPSIDQPELFMKPFAIGERRGIEELDLSFRGGNQNYHDTKSSGLLQAKHQQALGGEKGYGNANFRSAQNDANPHFQESFYKNNKQNLGHNGREQIVHHGHNQQNMLKKRKPYIAKKGEAVEISDVEEAPAKPAKKGVGALLLAESGMNLITGTRLVDGQPVQSYMGDRGDRNGGGFGSETNRRNGFTLMVAVV